MKTQILKINDPEKDIEKLKKAAECIDAGGLVVFPTETVYGIACRAEKKSFAKLDKVKKRDSDKRYTLHIGWREPSLSGDKNKLSDFVPNLTPPVKKLVADAWPGPLTIVFEIDNKDIPRIEKKIGEDTVKLLYKDNTIGIRCPKHDIACQLLNQCKFPVVAPSANISGGEPAADAQDALEQLDGLVDIVLDAGHCRYKKSSTVVKISPAGWQIIRAGAYSERQIRKMLTVNILFVCTGNTCRSPMAEGLAKKTLAEKFGCNIDQLEHIGYKIASAGTSAINGINVTTEAAMACDSKDADISNHKSRKITSEMLKDADYIFTMSAGHKNDIIRLYPEAEQKCMLLSDSSDINDPVGGSFETYKVCCGIIEKAVKKRISVLLK